MGNSKHLMRQEYTKDYGGYSEDRVILFDERDYTEKELNKLLKDDYVREEGIVNKKLIDIPLANFKNVFRSLLNGGED